MTRIACRAAALAALLLAAAVAAAAEQPLVEIKLYTANRSRPGDDLLFRAKEGYSPDIPRFFPRTIAVRGAPYIFVLDFGSPRLDYHEWQPGGPNPKEVVFTREWMQSVQCRIEVSGGGDVPFSWWEPFMSRGDLAPSYRIFFDPKVGVDVSPAPRFEVAVSGTLTAPLPVGEHRIACTAVWTDGSPVRGELPFTILANDSADSRALYHFQWGRYCDLPRLGCESESLGHYLAAAAEETTIPGVYAWAYSVTNEQGNYDRAADYLEKYLEALRWNVEHATPGYRVFEDISPAPPHERRWFDPKAELKEIEPKLKRTIEVLRAGRWAQPDLP